MNYLKSKKAIAATLVSLLVVSVLFIYPVLSQRPPPINTIQHGVGLYFPAVAADVIFADDYFFRDYNLTAFAVAVAEFLLNSSAVEAAMDVLTERNVEWGLVWGTTYDWFNHTLPGEPIYIGLQMHPSTILYNGETVHPEVLGKTDEQWQLGLYCCNGTEIHDPLLVMYHMRYEPGVDPNEPQDPNGGPR